MRNQKPPFEITNQIISDVAEIAELMGRFSVTNQLSTNPTLRRSNRIRTIHGSLAIEQNTLSLEQVTAVLDGNRSLPRPKTLRRSRMPMRYTSGWTSWTPILWMIC